MKTTTYALGSRGLRLVLLADLHNKPYERIIDCVKEQSPDIIAVAGDVAKSFEQYDRVGGFFKACMQLAPTYYTLGNHETLLEAGFASVVAESGVTLLDDAYADTVIGGVKLRIGGLSAPLSPHYARMKARKHGAKRQYTDQEEQPQQHRPNTRWLASFVDTADYKILLCHKPEYYPAYLNDLPIDLVFSGHAHGGQWRIPFTQQGIYAPGQGLFPELTGGVVDGAHGRLVISRGLSNTTWIPRFFNPREIVAVEI